jgi:hypothetical protein
MPRSIRRYPAGQLSFSFRRARELSRSDEWLTSTGSILPIEPFCPEARASTIGSRSQSGAQADVPKAS